MQLILKKEMKTFITHKQWLFTNIKSVKTLEIVSNHAKKIF